ncbi:MAG: hypothetical protein COZ05_00685 [Armatimonadetes bacterium CG_4_10_14_3_um_filter_59_10]|nr:MAG: hypothetical protein COZ05_00685 [Armatimonadetes bacterium CG_4_10_14_3_um_filter_59_10]
MALGSQLCELPDAEAIRCLMSKNLRKDTLEAVQAEAMDIGELKRKFGRDLTFWGGVGAQSVLHQPTRQMIEGVRQTLQVMAPGGRYIAAPCHTLTEEVPWENVLAFYEAMGKYGAYPHPGDQRRVLRSARQVASHKRRC